MAVELHPDWLEPLQREFDAPYMAALRQFLLEAHAHDYGCVRIIHGKGLQSDGGAPVLKNLVDIQLREMTKRDW